MSEQFKNYVTSTAFSLTLSKPMIEALSYMDQYGYTFCNMNTFSSLLNRGLVFRDTTAHGDLNEQLSVISKLTEAGKAVIPLLKLSGLYVELPIIERGVDLASPIVKLKTNSANPPEKDA